MLRAAILALTIGLTGCGASRPGWLGGTPPTAPVAGETFYASVGGLPVHEDASGSSAVVGRLALHERVTRSEVAHGYARVVGASGVTGWVDNAKLVWRLPHAATGAAPATGTPARAGAPTTAPAAEAPASPPSPTRASTAETTTEAPTAATTEDAQTPPAASATSAPTAVPAAATDTPPPTTPPARTPPRPYDPF